MMTRQRARTSAEKQAREARIVAAALELLADKGYSNINMNDVARAAGLAKGTVYLYFATREELFLSVFQQQVRVWFDDMESRLTALSAPVKNRVLARFLADSLAARPHLTRLAALNSTMLEYNVPYETIHKHKSWLYSRVDHLATHLERLLPSLPAGAGVPLVLRIFMLTVGVESVAHPAPVARQVMEDEPRWPQHAFADEFYRLLLAVLDCCTETTTTQGSEDVNA